jgi:hypothetical protein
MGIVAYCSDRDALILVNHPKWQRGGWIVNQLDVFDYWDFREVGQFGHDLTGGAVTKGGELN